MHACMYAFDACIYCTIAITTMHLIVIFVTIVPIAICCMSCTRNE